ncbi:Thermoresistant gluconokinase [Jannaschia seosinensis]|uniref:Gluconokinase n=1 Tax=Jannaschia seosinensis TaxID=313367 RepID=A0A0M7B6Z3_9RHOB|nr:gluconokinase [Jannaschia seosinensis]CUH28591.1 Thermoresistant gluconokinase [Jannaschia seosinensis]
MKIVVMGVTSTGKTEIGRRLAYALDGRFVDGDDLHPNHNVDKMARGEPLNDADRLPWLDQIGEVLKQADDTIVVACSALKRSYRDRIRDAAGEVTFVHLTGPKEVIAERMRQRKGHFMPASLLDSQLRTLEEPGPGEVVLKGDITLPAAKLTACILDGLHAANV